MEPTKNWVLSRPRTGRKISVLGGVKMPPRGKAPGLKRGRTLKDGTTLFYWIARQVVRNPMGFPDLCIPLPRDADDEMRGELCQDHTARLFAYLDALKTETA